MAAVERAARIANLHDFIMTALAFATCRGPFALMGGRVIYLDTPDVIQIDGGTLDRRTGVTGNLALGRSHAATPPPDPARLDFISGASMVASRAFYERAGPMAEGYFLYYEEGGLGAAPGRVASRLLRGGAGLSCRRHRDRLAHPGAAGLRLFAVLQASRPDALPAPLLSAKPGHGSGLFGGQGGSAFVQGLSRRMRGPSAVAATSTARPRTGSAHGFRRCCTAGFRPNLMVSSPRHNWSR